MIVLNTVFVFLMNTKKLLLDNDLFAFLKHFILTFNISNRKRNCLNVTNVPVNLLDKHLIVIKNSVVSSICVQFWNMNSEMICFFNVC